MKKIVSILSVLSVLMTTQWNLQAQRPQMGPPHRGPAVEKLVENLGLTDEQQVKLKALRETSREEVKALMDQEFDSREARHEAMKAMQEGHQEAMEAILTEAQLEKMSTLKGQKETQRREGRKAHMEQRKEMHDAMKSFHETEVLPVLKAQRAKLEAALTTEDKATLAALRAKKEANRPEKTERARGERRGKPEWTEAQREEIRADREKIRAMVEKYDSEITSLLEELREEHENWGKKKHEIAKKYAPEDLEDRPMRGGRGKMKGERIAGEKRSEGARKGKAGRFHHSEGRGEGMRKVGFLLLDPNAEAGAARTDKQEFAEVRVFPNPSASRNSVNYKLKENGHYRVELRDKDGLVLQVISNQYRKAGDYQDEIDLSLYAAGTYYVSIVGAEGVISKKIVVAK